MEWNRSTTTTWKIRNIFQIKKVHRPGIEPVSRQNKPRCINFSALIACANKAIVWKKSNRMNSKTGSKCHTKQRFLLFSFNKRSPRDILSKLSFLHMLFLENKAQIKKTNYTVMLFMSTQVSPPKIRSILQKWKSALNAIELYVLSARKRFYWPKNSVSCFNFCTSRAKSLFLFITLY